RRKIKSRRDVIVSMEELMNDIRTRNTCNVGLAGTGKSTIIQDLILTTSKEIDGKILVLSECGQERESVIYLGGDVFVSSGSYSNEVISWDSDVISLRFEDKEAGVSSVAAIKGFINYNKRDHLTIFIDNAIVVFGTIENYDEFLKIVKKNPHVRFIISTQ